jgi:hypothetical protein
MKPNARKKVFAKHESKVPLPCSEDSEVFHEQISILSDLMKVSKVTNKTKSWG